MKINQPAAFATALAAFLIAPMDIKVKKTALGKALFQLVEEDMASKGVTHHRINVDSDCYPLSSYTIRELEKGRVSDRALQILHDHLGISLDFVLEVGGEKKIF